MCSKDVLSLQRAYLDTLGWTGSGAADLNRCQMFPVDCNDAGSRPGYGHQLSDECVQSCLEEGSKDGCAGILAVEAGAGPWLAWNTMGSINISNQSLDVDHRNTFKMLPLLHHPGYYLMCSYVGAHRVRWRQNLAPEMLLLITDKQYKQGTSMPTTAYFDPEKINSCLEPWVLQCIFMKIMKSESLHHNLLWTCPWPKQQGFRTQ